MKKKIWKMILCLGLVPFVFPFGMWIFETLFHISSWQLMEWLVLYSFVYWPTYIMGFVLLMISVIRMKK